MERAFFPGRDNGPLPAGYDRLYLGAEFCPWTLPTLASLRHGMDRAHAAGLPISLTIPVFGEFFIDRLKSLLSELLPRFEAGDEVVISDWGALRLIRTIAPHVPIVIGRTLSGQKRGPQILDFDLGEEQLAYFRACRFYSREALKLLEEHGISRIELDYPPQGIDPVPVPLRASVHTPFAMVTSSRNCPFRDDDGASGCAADCGEVFVLSTPQSRLPLLQGGNTQFVRIDTLPDNLAELGIDRIVVHPSLPR